MAVATTVMAVATTVMAVATTVMAVATTVMAVATTVMAVATTVGNFVVDGFAQKNKIDMATCRPVCQYAFVRREGEKNQFTGS